MMYSLQNILNNCYIYKNLITGVFYTRNYKLSLEWRLGKTLEHKKI